MRKLLTLTLAVAMVLSMASVAFAITYNVSPGYYGESSSVVLTGGTTMVGYGKTAYYKVTNGVSTLLTYDEAKELKVKPQWTQNGDLVDKVSVVKKREGATAAAPSGYNYYIAVAIKAKDTTATTEISGKMELSVKSPNLVTDGGTPAQKFIINPFITVGYTQRDGATELAPVETGASPNLVSTIGFSQATTAGLNDSDQLFEFGNVDAIATADYATGDQAAAIAAIQNKLDAVKKYAATDEFEFDLFGSAGTFIVDTNGQGKILLSSSVQYNEGLEAIYPDANYVYINGNGKSFNKTGELKLWADEGEFLYQVKNGKLVKLNAEYDDVEEAFIIKTRTLGTYVIAEEELDLSAQDAPAAPVEEAPEAVNPGTGTAA